ncbi:MAG: alpha-2-macroglobulin family protein, partial [Saprospiraceae bacterium]
IKTEIIKPTASRTEYSFTITPDMFPNVYADVNLIQGLSEKKNDLPLRLYGVIPIMVENENLRLKPIINMSDKIRPDQEFTVEVSETNSASMAYQLMIVDDGLLNLTRFVTPDPYKDMFQKEALTLLSWDNYDDFIGNDLRAMQKIFSIGGDQKLTAEDISKMQRFKPIVLLSGPQKLNKGEKRIHKFTINNYIGSVRVMVVANNNDAFGSSDKTVIVRNELASQITFPRVCSIADKISVPVTVFKYDESISSANVSIKVSGPCSIVGDDSKSVNFENLKEKTVWFDLKPNGNIGEAHIECKATSGSFVSNSKVDFYIDNPNPISSNIVSYVVDAGKTSSYTVPEYGMTGTQKVKLEVTSLPNLKSEEYLNELIRYPHGCVEQTTSAAFPQLYVADYISINEDLRKNTMNNVSSAINKLMEFQGSDGGMSYWPGFLHPDDYSTSYVCHFISEAKIKGYQIPNSFLSKLIKYQSSVSTSFSSDLTGKESYKDFLQAYRLYGLANLNAPEWGAMNRLRQRNSSDQMTRWMLAGAYAIRGKKDIANQLINNIPTGSNSSEWYSYSYGSDIRDEAFMSMVLNDIGNREQAIKVLNNAINKLNTDSYPNTQELSTVMSAVGKIYKSTNLQSNGIEGSYSWNDKKESLSSPYSVIQAALNSKQTNQFSFTNNSSLPLTLNIIQSGKIMPEEKVNKSNTLKLEISYSDKFGKSINFKNLKQGQELTAHIRVANNGAFGNLSNIALTAVFPSGFELVNTRIGGINNLPKGIDYQDFRDDRIMYYFSLSKNEARDIYIPIIASYSGTYLSPLIECEAMYEPSINAQFRDGYVVIK